MAPLDLHGRKFGRLTALKLHGRSFKRSRWWWCVCDCGRLCVLVRTSSLLNGNTQSCGCYAKDRAAEANVVHGMRQSRLYNIWRGMKQRCLYPPHPRFSEYGGRGITICEDWMDPSTFFSWALTHGYDDTLTIDRVDPDGNYCPKNCRWVDYKEQNLNRRQEQPTITPSADRHRGGW